MSRPGPARCPAAGDFQAGELFQCASCRRGWDEVPAFLAARDLAVDGELPWLCLECAARSATGD